MFDRIFSPNALALLEAAYDHVAPDFDKWFDYVELAASIGMSAEDAHKEAVQFHMDNLFLLCTGSQAKLSGGRPFVESRRARQAQKNQLLQERGLKLNPPSPARSVKVFISYSSKDQPFAEKLEQSLRAKGYNVWLDKLSIKVGDSILAKIQQGLKESQYLVLLLSQFSVQSRWVEKEWQVKYWQQVEAGDVRLFPALIEKCEISTLLTGIRRADFTKDYDEGLKDLLDAWR